MLVVETIAKIRRAFFRQRKAIKGKRSLTPILRRRAAIG